MGIVKVIMKSICNRANAFTLVELIVSIAIIAILLALLVPALSGAKARAERTVCLNNIRQICTAIQLYCDDSSDKTPNPYGIKTNRMLTLIGYKKLLSDFVGSNDKASPKAPIFTCPSDRFYFGVSNSFIVLRQQALHRQAFVDYSSYGFNGGNLNTNLVDRALRHLGLDFSQLGVGGRSISSINDPSETILVAEVPAFTPYSWHEPKKPIGDNPQYCDSKNTVGFVDGHSAYLKIFWTNTASIGVRLDASFQNPPPGYDYKWSVN